MTDVFCVYCRRDVKNEDSYKKRDMVAVETSYCYSTRYGLYCITAKSVPRSLCAHLCHRVTAK